MDKAAFGRSGAEESYYAMTARPGVDFAAEARELLRRYDAASDPETLIRLRFHLSDPANQAALLRNMLGTRRGVVAMVGQPPAGGARLALEAVHWSGMKRRLRRTETEEELVVESAGYRHLFFRLNRNTAAGDEAQMREEFDRLAAALKRAGGTPEAALQRTWIYCRDIDNHYAGAVRGRRACFDRFGLTAATHYVASTGIEGQDECPSRLVSMDSTAWFGHRPEQVRYLKAPEFLSPTQLYGVTFERGVRLVYGDRSRGYLSGTASIDRDGRIVHPGDIVRQTERLFMNVEALLYEGRFTMRDLVQVVVYLRDPADLPAVAPLLAERLGDTPYLVVRAPVCRPGWLIELDGIAINGHGDPAFAPLV